MGLEAEPVPGVATGNGPLFSEIMDKFQTSARLRKPREGEWLVAKEFYRGNQYATWTKTYGLKVRPFEENDPLRQKKKPRLVYNYSRVMLENLLAYFLKNNPAFSASANHGDPKSQSAAILSRQLMRFYWMQLNLEDKLERTGLWVLNAGSAFWEIGWDPNAGPKMQMPVENPMQQPGMMQMLAGAMGIASPMMIAPEPQYEMRPIGDPYIRLRSPFECYPDFGAETIDDAQWFITATMRPVPTLKKEFPDKADLIKPEMPDFQQSYQRQALSSFGANMRGYPNPEKMNRAMVIEYWARPTQEYPDGLRVVMTQNAILAQGATPDGYDHIPFAMWGDRLVPGDFWPDSTMRDLLSPQKELNKRASQMVEMSDRHKIKWLAVEGSVSADQINDEDSEVIIHQPGPRPEPIAPPPWPEGPVKMVGFTKEMMEQGSGSNPALMGMSSPGEEVRSGRQQAYKQMGAEGRVGLLAKHMARFLSRSGSLLLRVLNKNVTEQRVAQIVGPNREAQTRFWTGADLEGATDVTCELGSILGFTRSERFDKGMTLVDKGVLPPQRALEFLQIEDYYPIIEEDVMDRNNAMAEEEQWRQSDFSSQPYYFDGHETHLGQHNLFRKSADYRRMPPEVRMQIDAHCQVHEQYVRALAMGPGAAGGIPPPAAPGGAPVPGEAAPIPGAPPPASEVNQAIQQGGQEIAEGLPVPPPIPANVSEEHR